MAKSDDPKDPESEGKDLYKAVRESVLPKLKNIDEEHQEVVRIFTNIVYRGGTLEEFVAALVLIDKDPDSPEGKKLIAMFMQVRGDE